MCLMIFQKRNKCFKAIKIEIKKKKLKSWDFSKGLSPWVWSKISNFPIFLLFTKSDRKMCLTILWKGKKLFYTIKNKKFKKSKNWDFSKLRGQSMILVKNLKFFYLFIFGKISQQMCLTIFQKEKKRFQTLESES